VTAFGAGAGLPRGKTSCLLITRDDKVRWGAGSDPYANGLQALFGDGGTAAREAFGHHNKLLRRRQRSVRAALKTLGVATGPVEQQKNQQLQHTQQRQRPAVPSLPSDGGAVA
jgi:hypothetical protein